MEAISAIDAMAAKKPTKVPMYTHIAPPVPPLMRAKVLAENCASQVAMRTIVKPKMDRKRKLR
jgi:hypothetical protein